jgi:hypothetical protein
LCNMSFTIGLLSVVLPVFLVLGVCLTFLLLLVLIIFPSLIRALSNEMSILATILTHTLASNSWLFSFVSFESSSFSHVLVVVLD